MSRQRLFRIPVALLLGLALASCQQTGKQSVGLQQADSLVGCIEAVHVETDLAQSRMREALDALRVVTTPGLEGDVLSAYTEFVEAIERSEQQAVALRAAVEPMKATAGPFFGQWKEDLDAFTSSAMRQRSQTRLLATRARYDAVVAAVEPSVAGYDTLNLTLRDHALFLGRDLNASSLAEIEADVRVLQREADALDESLDATLVATREYVGSSALPERAGAPSAADGAPGK